MTQTFKTFVSSQRTWTNFPPTSTTAYSQWKVAATSIHELAANSISLQELVE